MKKTVQLVFSDQAETIIDNTDYGKEEVVDFLAENGFTVGGSEVVQFLENR